MTITLLSIMEEVQGGPAHGRVRSGRGTRGRGSGRCANRGRGLDGLEDAAVGGGRGGAADREEHGHGRGCGRGRVNNVDRQRLVDAFEDGDDYHELAALLGIPHQTAGSIIHVWLVEGRVQRLPEGGNRNIKLTDDMQVFIRDEQEKLYNSLSSPSLQLVRNWRFASQTRQFQTSNFVSQPGTFKTSSSPPRLLERTAMYRMKEIVPTQSSDAFNTPHGFCQPRSVHIYIYLFVPHHQFLLSKVSTNVKYTLTSRGLTSLLGEAKAVHH